MPEAHPISAAETSVAAFLGASLRGASYRARTVTSFADFTACFGPLRSDLELGYAASLFFQNGGRTAWIVRVPQRPTAAQWQRGLTALNSAPAINLLLLPGVTGADARAAALAHAQTRRAFVLFDPPRSASSVQDMLASAASAPPSPDAAVYYPCLVVADPAAAGQPRVTAPSGAIAGVLARIDRARGVWKAPAGADSAIVGAVRQTAAVSESDGTTLSAAAVNCLRTFPGQGIVLWGARTLAGKAADASEWKYVPIRRLALFLQQSIETGLQWAVSERNQEPLWTAVRSAVATFLHEQFRRGAFVGSREQDAYFLKCGRDTMTAADIAAGRLVVLVGFAALKPAEFVIFRLSQMVRSGT